MLYFTFQIVLYNEIMRIITQNILIQGLVWQFFDVPKEILKGWGNFLLFNLDYFSIPILIKTFLSHWRRYYTSYGKGFSPKRYFEAFIFNMMSRIIGAILRTFFIFLGLLVEILIVFIGAIIFLGWLLLPFLLIFSLVFGLKLLF